jgi:tRNA A-37 threonylcarbamoyl transferase component Bud32
MARGDDEPWIAAESLPPELGRAWAHEWPRWFGPERVGLPRAQDKHALALVETPLGPMVAKREHARGWKRSLARIGARPSRPERAFLAAGELRERGLATPEPMAVLGRPGTAVLVTRYVVGRGPWELLREHGASALLATLARGLARLHGAGFRHRDLKASNLLFASGGGPNDAPALLWTDLDGLRRLGTVEPRLRARDLARLCTSFESAAARAAGVRADHWPALVRLYLEHALSRPPEAAELASLSAWTRAWSARWIRRHLARGQPVG